MIVSAALALDAVGPTRWQSVLDPRSPQAAGEAHLLEAMMITAAVVFVVVIAAFLYAGLRKRSPSPDPARPTVIPTAPAGTLRTIVGSAVGVTVVILFVFVVSDFALGRAQGALPGNVMTIDVTGHMWWWEITYPDTAPQHVVETANELHIPVGVPIRIRLHSHDVIHSFWVPNLRGKKDAVPGYESYLWFVADTAGVYRGQCAEFCGHEHAKMALFVVAQPRAEFEQWLEGQRKPASTPTDSMALAGEQVFLAGPCAKCHAISGTRAAATLGPDLTHLASRGTIASGTLPNTPGNLAGWIVDPQSIKPGTEMPSTQLAPDQLQALLAYLGSLK